MNRWFVLILLVTIGAKFVSSGLMVSVPHGMDMQPCDGARCGVATDQCVEHCLAVWQTDTPLPAVAPLVFLLVAVALVIGFAVVTAAARPRAYTAPRAPPGLAFVRNTILRE